MGRGRKGNGVELRDNSVRVSFTWQGERCRETLDLTPTPSHEKYAARLVDEIRRRIGAGTFRYVDFFPESPHAEPPEPAPERRSFGHYCQLFLESKGRTAEATKSQYRNALAFWKGQIGADRRIDTVTLPSSPRSSAVTRGRAGNSATTT